MDQVKFAPQMENLCSQIQTNCQALTETVPYQDFNIHFLRSRIAQFDAVVMSGSEALYSKPEDKGKFLNATVAIKELESPVLGICGGHQLIAMAYGEQIVAMGRSIKEYQNVEILVDDPLFESLPREISVMQSHQEMVEKSPIDFRLLAHSENTPIEALRESHRILYGVQFHPERSDSNHLSGAKVLENFGRLIKK